MKKYLVNYWVRASVDFKIEAENAQAAEARVQEIVDNGECEMDFTSAEWADSGIECVGEIVPVEGEDAVS